jgi:hypothetical protein
MTPLASLPSKLLKGGHVTLQGEIVQGFGLSYIPQNLSANGCINCKDLLNVTFVSGPMIPSVSVEYVKASQYKFVIRFKWSTTNLANMVFNFTVRLNPQYAPYFSVEDMNQVQFITIDSALLSRFDKVDTLTFEQIAGVTSPTGTIILESPTQIPSGASLGIPDQAMKILFTSI